MGELRVVLQDCRVNAKVDECYLNFYKSVPHPTKKGQQRLSYVGEPIQIDPSIIDSARLEAKHQKMTSEEENEFVINSILCYVDIKGEMKTLLGSVPQEIISLYDDLRSYDERTDLGESVPITGLSVGPQNRL